MEKIQGGAIGQVSALYAHWIGTPVIQQPKGRRPEWRDMEWQHRNWYSFVWICGDQIVEQHFHNIDFMNWVMGSHPVEVVLIAMKATRRSRGGSDAVRNSSGGSDSRLPLKPTAGQSPRASQNGGRIADAGTASLPLRAE